MTHKLMLVAYTTLEAGRLAGLASESTRQGEKKYLTYLLLYGVLAVCDVPTNRAIRHPTNRAISARQPHTGDERRKTPNFNEISRRNFAHNNAPHRHSFVTVRHRSHYDNAS
eukprot:767191-Prymnesium_polylepis.1